MRSQRRDGKENLGCEVPGSARPCPLVSERIGESGAFGGNLALVRGPAIVGMALPNVLMKRDGTLNNEAARKAVGSADAGFASQAAQN